MKKKLKKRKINFRIGANEKEIIKFVGLGVLVLSSLILPGLPIALKPFFKQRGKKQFQKTIEHLNKKGVIYLHGDKVKLSKRGREFLKLIQAQEIEIKRPKRWDGIWHLVSYDIPNERKKERDLFRSTLQRLGFEQIQESLWVFPFECKEEIAVIAQGFRVSHYVIVMRTDHLPEQKSFERFFDLS